MKRGTTTAMSALESIAAYLNEASPEELDALAAAAERCLRKNWQ